MALSETLVAIDLETTGVDPDRDAIIEVGAVKFNSQGVLDQFTSLIAPARSIPQPVQALTGIQESELEGAPMLDEVVGDIEDFIGDCPLVGHNSASFDADFLDAAGIRRSAVVYDTFILASLLLPGIGQYSLRFLTEWLKIPFPVQHRALPDAIAHKDLFLALQKEADQLSPELLSKIAAWLAPTNWPWRQFFQERAGVSPGTSSVSFATLKPFVGDPIQPIANSDQVETDAVTKLLASASAHPELLPQFEERPQQVKMAHAVTAALNENESLIVEAATGTGKSLAYLVPAALYALKENCRLIISTSTINLQEQLANKDIPILKALLASSSNGWSSRELRSAQLKGRQNYLCLHRLELMQASSELDDDEAKMMTRLAIWLTKTENGDRSELNLSRPEELIWQRLNAGTAGCSPGSCPYALDGSCFLTRARRQAEAAHLVVINHAMLLSDVAIGGHLLPSYSDLIIDEAHHLEQEATRQLGFSAGEDEFRLFLDRCRRLSPELRKGLRSPAAALGPAAPLAGVVAELDQAAERARTRAREFMDYLRDFLEEQETESSGYDNQLLINRAMRVQPNWSKIEIAWEDLRLALSQAINLLRRLSEELAAIEQSGLLNYGLIVIETSALLQQGQTLMDGFTDILKEDPERIVWVTEGRRSGIMKVASAPLSVAELLRERLYATKDSIIFTGATLSSQGSFDYMRERIGLAEAKELCLESPFDYQKAVLLLTPTDMPEPDQSDYTAALAKIVSELGKSSRGRGLVLFTSHSSLRAAYRPIRDIMAKEGIDVVGQGIDGSPSRLLRALRSNSRTLLLGTSSFWEGVDVAGEALSLLVITRLPFNVPTEPVFTSRAAHYEEPFREYALPQAVLRFKQGFGRLIRTKNDRGVVAILDQRIGSKNYGNVFLESLPSCRLRRGVIQSLPDLAARWLSEDNSFEQED